MSIAPKFTSSLSELIFLIGRCNILNAFLSKTTYIFTPTRELEVRAKIHIYITIRNEKLYFLHFYS